MLQFITVVAMVYAISWIISTPEGRAKAKPWADKWGKRALAVIVSLWAILALVGWMSHRDDPTPPGDHGSGEQ